ncbi:MAG: DUF2141 domain-containing protein [Polymorphobacter sp.]
MKLLILAIAAAFAIPAAPSLAQAAPAAAPGITIAFTGIATPTGMIMISLFDSGAAYNGGKPVRVAAVPADGAAIEAHFEGLPAGRYAVKAFHDVDGDGKMAVNPFGMPTEPFAFSNDAVGEMGPARWDQAAFDATAATRHTITIR